MRADNFLFPSLSLKRSLCAAVVLSASIQLSGCVQNEDSGAVKQELAQAKQKIAALEQELAVLKKSVNPAVQAAASQVPLPEPAPNAADKIVDEPSIGKQWAYRLEDEKMSGGTRKTATVVSTNSVNFDFPYSGEQNGRITLRADPRFGKDVIFAIERGQILCPSYDGCSVQVRFDEEKPIAFSASPPADHSSEVVFLNDYGRFVAKLRKAKRVRLSLDIYQNGRPVYEFDVSGFDQQKYQAKP